MIWGDDTKMSAKNGEWPRIQIAMVNIAKLRYGLSMADNYQILAIWDDEAKVFTSQSTIPGLVVEADTFEEFVELVEALAPEVLAANLPGAKRPYKLDIQSHRTLEVA
jgi:Domain of unknown function (DUF1902)